MYYKIVHSYALYKYDIIVVYDFRFAHVHLSFFEVFCVGVLCVIAIIFKLGNDCRGPQRFRFRVINRVRTYALIYLQSKV